jgi:hypothetical protein
MTSTEWPWGDTRVKPWYDGRGMKTVKFSSCQDLILASPGTNPVDVIRLRVEASLEVDAERGQALVHPVENPLPIG